ncbi:related to putative transcriptional regulator [Rhynchosporium agropyri]|uniref:Related to putative transcriptional regulator n=2 Tax=Rhynchosporium TaxID=38037 RepID=A0A1E1MB24_RHYSE|nr:related to putative transcriptional regulator [Rhynchosporium agropyri]CZT46312.1 related to putative transcriptional regulator [Rhynchosporium secalis]
MSLVSQHLSNNTTNSLFSSAESQFHAEGSKNTTRDDDNNVDSFNPFTEAALSKLLGVSAKTSPSSMDRGSTQYTQSGLHSPLQHAFSDTQSEEASADHASAAHYTPQVRSNYSAAATPTSEFGAYPASARSGSFPEHIHRQYHPPSNHSGSSGGGMAQPTSPSLPLQDGRTNHHTSQIKSDDDVPIDPSIAASSPSYPPQHGGPYSPYPPGTEMQHGYQQHAAGGPMYAQPRPDWAGYAGGQQHPMHGGYPVSGAQTPTSAAPAGARPGQHGLAQVYSFVPIPGAQQHKRPRRRYEEIERMYKCGWNGCEKAYGTLNHLNAHVTMQSHGQKRTPEEFKEIRKEWKARKKEEDNQRKAEDERVRSTVVSADGQNSSDNPPPGAYQQPGRSVQLPPIAYQPGAQVQAQYQGAPSGGVQQLQSYAGDSHLQYSGYPASPYGAPNHMYNHNPNPATKYEH